MINRLQFLHKSELFETREEAIKFLDELRITRPSLYAEPVVVRYGNAEEPNVIFAIGATGSGTSQPTIDTSYFMIDAQGIKDDIKEKYDEIENALAKLALAVVDTDTLHLEKENTENGITLKGNVKVSENVTINRSIYDNIIKKSENGLYSYVNVEFNDTTNTFTFQVNESVKKFSVPVIESGRYDISKEAIVFTYTDGKTTEVDVDDLIGEWTTEGENSETPIVLTKERHTDENTNINDRNSDHWKDVLKADVRIASDKEDNILEKTTDGRNLYVKGTADNIQYKGGENVEKAIDRLGSSLSDESDKLNSLSASSYFEVGETDTIAMSKNADVTSHTVTADVKVSSKDKNTILVDGNKGLYASFDYDANRNVIIISDTNNDTHKREIQLNSVSSIEYVRYDKTSEKIIIGYKSNGSSSETHTLEIPITDILSEWETNNSGHSVRLIRTPHAVNGTDELSGDVVLATEGNYSDNLIKKVTTTAYDEEMKGLYVSGEEVSGSARAIAKEEAKDVYDKAIKSAKTYTDTQNVSLSGAIKTYVDNEVGGITLVGDTTNTTTVNVTDKKIAANVRIASGDRNRIIANADGLYVGDISATYDAQTNILTINGLNGQPVLTHKLNSASFIDSINYDENTHYLNITYHTTEESSATTVPINLTGLIKDTKADETSNTPIEISVSATSENGVSVNKIKGDVNIANNVEGNILRTVTQSGKGALYADASGILSNISALSASTVSLSNKTDGVKEEIGNIETSAGFDNEGNYIHSDKPYISDATSLADADKKLADAVASVDKSITNLTQGSKTYSVNVFTEKDDNTNASLLKADVRLSVANGQDESELTRTEMPNEGNLLQVVKAKSNGLAIELGEKINGLYFGGSIDYGMMKGDDTLNG
jgi:hypothetical protein